MSVTVIAGGSFEELVDDGTLSEVKSVSPIGVEWVVDSVEVFDSVVDELRWTMNLKEKLDSRRKEATAPLDKSKKSIMDLFRPHIERLDARIEYLRRLVSAWQVRVAAEQASARLEAERLAEEEKQKMRLLSEKLEGDGKHDEASRVLYNSTFITPSEPVGDPKVKGVSSRARYVVEVTDMAALCAHIGANPVLSYLVAPVTSELNRLATSLNGDLKIPGVQAKLTNIPIVRKS